MKVTAWIQMGRECREVDFEVPAEQRWGLSEDDLERYIEDVVLDWISCRYGWGWRVAGACDDLHDASDGEDSDICAYVITGEVLNAQTRAMLVNPRSDWAKGTPKGHD